MKRAGFGWRSSASASSRAMASPKPHLPSPPLHPCTIAWERSAVSCPASNGASFPFPAWIRRPLEIRGGNVMLGYIDPTQPGGLRTSPDGWYDTGDIVEVDAEGFVRIVGRLKRFAKVGGEMVSLAVAEETAREIWPEADHAAVAVPDPRKGERVVLVTTRTEAEADSLAAAARRRGIPEIAIPRQVYTVPEIPLLGAGKPNYPAITAMVAEMDADATPKDSRRKKRAPGRRRRRRQFRCFRAQWRRRGPNRPATRPRIKAVSNAEGGWLVVAERASSRAFPAARSARASTSTLRAGALDRARPIATTINPITARPPAITSAAM